MSREEFLKKCIADKGYNIKEFATEIDMPYTTLLSILNKSVGGASLDNIIKICHGLDINLDILSPYKSNNEGHILYDQLDAEDQAEIRGEMKQMLKSPKYNKTNIADEIAEDISKLMNMRIHTNTE